MFSKTYSKRIEEAFNNTEAHLAETVVAESANKVILKVSGNELAD
jgi:hypothetical protein